MKNTDFKLFNEWVAEKYPELLDEYFKYCQEWAKRKHKEGWF